MLRAIFGPIYSAIATIPPILSSLPQNYGLGSIDCLGEEVARSIVNSGAYQKAAFPTHEIFFNRLISYPSLVFTYFTSDSIGFPGGKLNRKDNSDKLCDRYLALRENDQSPIATLPARRTEPKPLRQYRLFSKSCL